MKEPGIFADAPVGPKVLKVFKLNLEQSELSRIFGETLDRFHQTLLFSLFLSFFVFDVS